MVCLTYFNSQVKCLSFNPVSGRLHSSSWKSHKFSPKKPLYSTIGFGSRYAHSWREMFISITLSQILATHKNNVGKRWYFVRFGNLTFFFCFKHFINFHIDCPDGSCQGFRHYFGTNRLVPVGRCQSFLQFYNKSKEVFSLETQPLVKWLKILTKMLKNKSSCTLLVIRKVTCSTLWRKVQNSDG